MTITPNNHILEFSFLNITEAESRISAKNPSELLQEGRRVRLGLSRTLDRLLPGELFLLPHQIGVVYKKTEVDPFYSETPYVLQEIRDWPHYEYDVIKR